MYPAEVTEREKGRHSLSLTEAQAERREALLDHLGLDESDLAPARSDDRRAITGYVTNDEWTELDYLARRAGFRGVSALSVALMRSHLATYEPPRLKARGRRGGSRRSR